MKTLGVILICSSLLIIIVCLLRKKEYYFNLREVIRNHLSLFDDCKCQYVVFYVLPLILAIGLAMIYEAGDDFYTELSVVMGIILSMLFAILSILSGHDYSSVKDELERKKVKEVVEETLYAIVFTSLLCVFLLLYGMIMIVVNDIAINIQIISFILPCMTYYVFAVIVMNLLLIVKHMSRIIEFNLNVKRR